MDAASLEDTTSVMVVKIFNGIEFNRLYGVTPQAVIAPVVEQPVTEPITEVAQSPIAEPVFEQQPIIEPVV